MDDAFLTRMDDGHRFCPHCHEEIVQIRMIGLTVVCSFCKRIIGGE